MAWWKPWTAWIALAGGFVLLLIARSLVEPEGDGRPRVAAALILLTLATAAVPLLCAAVQRRPVAADFGLVGLPLRRAVPAALATVVGVFVLATLSTTLLQGNDDPVDVTERLAAESSTVNAVLVLVLIAVATPLAEELLFRAYAFRALVPWRGPVAAAVLSGTAFILFHLDWAPAAAFPTIAFFGLAMCWLYVRTGSLYPPLAVHALVNATSAAPTFDGAWAAVAVLAAVALTLACARALAAVLDNPRPVPRPTQPTVSNRSTIS